MSESATARTYFWHINFGPHYTCRDQDDNEVPQGPADLRVARQLPLRTQQHPQLDRRRQAGS